MFSGHAILDEDPKLYVMAARALMLPGNGCSPIASSNWYSHMAASLRQNVAISEVIMRDMPDPLHARESMWIPFIKDELKPDERTIIVGHSSGAVAAMRLLEEVKVRGVVLVAACHTDLGDEHERSSGYYSRPWLWDKIKSNCDWILQFHSPDDPFIPTHEADHIAQCLDLVSGESYFNLPGHSHYFTAKHVKPVIEAITRKLEC